MNGLIKWKYGAQLRQPRVVFTRSYRIATSLPVRYRPCLQASPGTRRRPSSDGQPWLSLSYLVL
jgi:hypothetical protein